MPRSTRVCCRTVPQNRQRGCLLASAGTALLVSGCSSTALLIVLGLLVLACIKRHAKWPAYLVGDKFQIVQQPACIVSYPPQHFQVAKQALAPVEGSAVDGSQVFPELAEMRENKPRLPPGVDAGQTLLAGSKLTSGPPQVFAMKEQRFGNAMKGSMQGQFGQHAAVGIGKVPVDRSLAEDICPNQTENWFTHVIHADQIAETYVRFGDADAGGQFIVRCSIPVFINVETGGIAQYQAGIALQYLEAALNVFWSKNVIVCDPQKEFR